VVRQAQPAHQRRGAQPAVVIQVPGTLKVPGTCTADFPTQETIEEERHQQAVERIDLRDRGLGPPRGRQREDCGRHGCSGPAAREAPADEIEQADRSPCKERGQEIDPPRGIPHRQQGGGELAEQRVKRIAAGMRDAERGQHHVKFEAIIEQGRHRPRRRGRVQDERQQSPKQRDGRVTHKTFHNASLS